MYDNVRRRGHRNVEQQRPLPQAAPVNRFSMPPSTIDPYGNAPQLSTTIAPYGQVPQQPSTTTAAPYGQAPQLSGLCYYAPNTLPAPVYNDAPSSSMVQANLPVITRSRAACLPFSNNGNAEINHQSLPYHYQPPLDAPVHSHGLPNNRKIHSQEFKLTLPTPHSSHQAEFGKLSGSTKGESPHRFLIAQILS